MTQQFWYAYEAAKQAWLSANQKATAQEYEAAMQAIAQGMGL